MSPLELLKRFWTGNRYVAVPVDCSYVSGAEMSVHDGNAVLTVAFETPVADGNDVSHMNARMDGQVAFRRDLYAGDRKAAIQFDGQRIGARQLDLLFIDTAGDIAVQDTVEIRKL